MNYVNKANNYLKARPKLRLGLLIAAVLLLLGGAWFVWKRSAGKPNVNPEETKDWAENYLTQLVGIEQQAVAEGRTLNSKELDQIEILEAKLKEIGWKYLGEVGGEYKMQPA